jgi:hypothetical protein
MNIIPFASATNGNTPETNSSGDTTRVVLIGFGNSHSIYTDSPTQFTIKTGDNWYNFAMPQDGIIDSIYGEVSTAADWTPSSNISPYFAIATAPPDSVTFTIIPQSITPVSTPYVQGTLYRSYAVRSASATGLGIAVTAGTRVMIVGGIRTSGGTRNQSLYFSFNGGISIR